MDLCSAEAQKVFDMLLCDCQKVRVKLLMELYLTAMGYHLPYGITEGYLPLNTSEHTQP